jgi:hypothetical protein
MHVLLAHLAHWVRYILGNIWGSVDLLIFNHLNSQAILSETAVVTHLVGFRKKDLY